jgi:regulator of replication initiation timing
MTLKFNEWSSLNEAGIFDKIKNWLSGTFGGSIDSLDKLANEYRSAELEYVEKWEDINVEIDKLDLERSQTKSDPAEIKRIDRLIQRNNELMEAQVRSHEKKAESIFTKVKDVISENKRVRIYWEKLKTKVDADIAEEMYKRAKNLADSSLSGSLYNKYKAAVLKAKQKDTDFRNRYGNLMTKDIESGERFKDKSRSSRSTSDSDKSTKSGNESDASFEFLAKLPLTEFTNAIKGYIPAQAKKLVTFLLKERNDRYVAMDMERDILNKEVENSSSPDEARKFASKRIKEIREKYMDEIRDLRSKITIARKYA